LFVLCLVVWVILVWPFDPETCAVHRPDIVAGLVAALLTALVMREVTEQKALRLFDPRRYFWLIVYAAVLLYYIVKANFDVAYRVLHPEMPIRPGIVKVRTRLRTASAITALSNSITLTPGTLTVDAEPDGWMYIHWIYVRATDPQEAAEHITARFEWFLARIFE